MVSLSGIVPSNLVTAMALTMTGDIHPGYNGRGVFPISANTLIPSGNTYNVNIQGTATAGTNYDQLLVTGTVDITDVNLTLVDNFGGSATPFDILTIINNDDVDPVVGTFTGLPDGSPIAFNGETWYIYYDQGDGNDVVLRSSAINVEVDASGNLVFNDSVGEDDELTIVIDGTNYRISDPNKPVIAGQGATQDGNDVLVTIASVIGAININTQDGDDSLNVDLDGGNFGDIVNYDGGNQNSSPGDIMLLSATGNYASVTHNFTNANDGFIDVTGNTTFNYVGLEPIVDNLNAADRIFNFNGGAETITLDSGGVLDNQIDSTLGEIVDFTNPSNSLTINGGTGDDIINIEGVDAGFDADLNVNGNDANDMIVFQTNATNLGSGNLTTTSENLQVLADVSTTGAIATTTTSGSYVNNATIQTTDGDITMLAGSAPTAGLSQSGIAVVSGTIQTTGTGNISLTGTVATIATSVGVNGVYVGNGSMVSTVTGAINITGNGASIGDRLNMGVRFSSSPTIQSVDGVITVSGNGTNGTGNLNIGLNLFSGTVMQVTGIGTINLSGLGGTGGTDRSYGIAVNGSSVTTSGGGMTLNGFAGAGTTWEQTGVDIRSGGSLSDSADGDIIVNGLGSLSGSSGNYGIAIIDSGSALTTSNGNITMTGFGGGNGTDVENLGIVVAFDARVESTGTGSITLNGTGGNGTEYSTGIDNTTAIVRTNNGDINYTGIGGTGTLNYNNGVSLFSNTVVESTGTGAVTITGTGGTGIDENNGVLNSASNINSNGGNIAINGTAGNGGYNNNGVVIATGNVANTSGDTFITGIGMGLFDNNNGVYVNGSSILNTTTGNLSITGNATTTSTGQFNFGVRLDNPSLVQTADGTITLNGTGGTGTGSFNAGIGLIGGSVIATGVGSLSFTGIGGSSGVQFQSGIYMQSGNVVESNGGGITMTGTGGTGVNFANGITLRHNGNIQDNNGGHISLTGTGGNGNGGDMGLFFLQGDFSVSTSTGAITLNGTATNTIGGINDGIFMQDTPFINSGSGTITMNGTSADALFSGINITSLGGAITTSGNIIANANIGELNTPAGIPATAIFDAGSTTINGVMAPGQSPGQMTVNGSFNLSSGDTYEWEIDNNTTPGSDFDQIVVNGIVDITDATLNLIDNFAGALPEADEYVIIDNDGTDAVVGTFNGLANNDAIPFNGQFLFIYYDGGDGNDVVLVVDSTPTAFCQPFTAELDASGNVTILPSDVDGGSFDPDGPVTLTLDNDTFSCADVGPNTVTLTVTDSTGNTASCTAIVTVVDNIFPTWVNTPTDLTVECDGAGNVTDFNDWLNNTFTGTDNCPNWVITNDSTGLSDDCGETGSETVTFTLTDASGNAITETVTFTIEDTIDPTWDVIPTDLTVECDGAGNVTDFNDWLNNTFSGSDSCSGFATVTNNSTGLSDDCGETGSETVTFTLTDDCGNDITETVTFTIEDTVDPFWDVAPADLTVECDGAGNVADFDAWLNSTFSGSDTCSGSAVVTHNSTGLSDDCGETGSETVTFTLTDDCGNDITMDATFTIEDTTPAVIGCPGDVTAFTEDGDCGAIVLFQNAVAIEECGDVIVYQTEGLGSGSVFPIGDTLIEFTAQDSCGNLSTCTFTVTVVDDDAPTAVCQNITVQLDDTGNASITANEVNFGSSDNCGVGTLEIDIDTFDCSNVGDNDVTLTVTDVNGNSSTCVAVVTVEDVTAPVVACQDIVVELGADGTVTIDPMDVDGGSSDACGIATYELNIDTFGCLDVGDSTVILTVTDVNGNQSSCSATVTVEDNMAPELVCMDVTLELNQDGIAYIIPSQLVETINDPCGVLVFTADVDELYCSDIGTPVTVNIFANDGNGNSSFCSSTVTVVDVLGPQIVCPPNEQVNLDPNGTYTLGDYIGDGIATATDNCTDPVTIFTQDPAAGTTLGFGVQTITFTAEDEYGNVSTCSFELDVQEILGANDSEDFSSLVLYPNPADNKVHLSNPRLMDLNEVTVYDLTGRIVNKVDLSNMGSEITIDVSNLANATYLLVIKGSQGTSTKQLIVNNY